MAILLISGCQKTYSVEDFKKDNRLREEWSKKCALSEPSIQSSQNCENVLKASTEMFFHQERTSTDRGHAF